MGKRNETVVKSKERKRIYAEVNTPMWLVNNMLDMLQQENDFDVFEINKKYLEPACGDGNFLIEILHRKLRKCKNSDDIKNVLKSIYGIDIQLDNVVDSRKRLLTFCTLYFPSIYKDNDELIEECKQILERNIVHGNMLTKCDLEGNLIWFLQDESEEQKQMTIFDFIS